MSYENVLEVLSNTQKNIKQNEFSTVLLLNDLASWRVCESMRYSETQDNSAVLGVNRTFGLLQNVSD